MTATTTAVQDFYPTRGPAEVVTSRRDPVVWGPPSPGLKSYERDGFLTDGHLLSDDETDTYRAELDRLIHHPALGTDERWIIEPKTQQVRSVFEVHKISDVFADLVRDERVAGTARRILGSDVYVHQSRINVKPGFGASGFYWHSDFETWHAEDGLPRMRTVSVSIALTENHDTNGSLMIMPGSHRTFIGCAGRTHARLRRQHHAVPAQQRLHRVQQRGEHGGGTVRGTGTAAGVHRGAGLHAGEVRSDAEGPAGGSCGITATGAAAWCSRAWVTGPM